MPTPKATRSLGSDPTHHGSKDLDWARSCGLLETYVAGVLTMCQIGPDRFRPKRLGEFDLGRQD